MFYLSAINSENKIATVLFTGTTEEEVLALAAPKGAIAPEHQTDCYMVQSSTLPNPIAYMAWFNGNDEDQDYSDSWNVSLEDERDYLDEYWHGEILVGFESHTEAQDFVKLYCMALVQAGITSSPRIVIHRGLI